MTTPATPSDPKPAADDRNLVAVDASTASNFEEKLHVFWAKNGTAVMALVGLVLVGIIAKGGWDYLGRQKELDIEKDYAAAITPEARKAFIAAHPGHSLSGVGQLRLADEAYTAGKSADALAGYEKTLTLIKEGPLAARAKLGIAMAKIFSGKAAEGATELKALAGDPNQFKGVRAEAAYQLTSLAADASNGADVQKYADQLMSIDPSSPWAQRAMGLRAMFPAVPAPAPAAPAAAKDAAPAIKLPGK
jgi:predicted negative regulator of RcsB-dependent stress response